MNNDIYFLSNDVQLEVAITLILLLNRDLIIVLNIIVTIRREKLIKILIYKFILKIELIAYKW